MRAKIYNQEHSEERRIKSRVENLSDIQIQKYKKNNEKRLIKNISEEELLKRREISRKSSSKNKQTRRDWFNKKYKTDILFKLKLNIKSNIKNTLRNNNIKKHKKTIEILGCDFEFFKKHLEEQFEPWMNWENHGKYKTGVKNYGWDIDHIIPISTAITKEDLYKLNHYTNLQPLCSYTNRYIKRNII